MIVLELEAKSAVIENSIDTAKKSLMEFHENIDRVQMDSTSGIDQHSLKSMACQIDSGISLLHDKWKLQVNRTRDIDGKLQRTKSSLLILKGELSEAVSRINSLNFKLKKEPGSSSEKSSSTKRWKTLKSINVGDFFCCIIHVFLLSTIFCDNFFTFFL